MKKAFLSWRNLTIGALLLGTGTFWTYGSADAASIRGVNRKKGVVVLDSGSEGGLKKGMNVCFNDSKGKQIDCGKIVSLKKKTSTVKLNKAASARRLKRGMEAITDGEAAVASASSSKAGAKYRRNVKTMYIMTPMFPSTYQKLAYAPPPVTGDAETLWEPIGEPDISVMGFGAEVEMGIGATMSTAIGFRMRLHRDFASEADYIQRELTADGQKQAIPEYVEALQTTSAMGFWADFYFYDVRFGQSLSLRLGSGIDMDMSTVTVKATQKDDRADQATIGEFVTATSKLSVISLRLIPSLNFFIDPVGFTLTPVVLVPLAAMGAAFSGENLDTHAANLGGVDPMEDLKAALGHDKGSMSLMITLSAFFAF